MWKKEHRLDRNVFLLFKEEEEHLYFVTQIEAFSCLHFVARFFSIASGKLFYLDVLSEKVRNYAIKMQHGMAVL